MAKTVSINILGNAAQAIAALDAVGIKAEEVAAKTDTIGKSSDSAGSKIANFGKMGAFALLGIGAASIKLAGNFDSATTTLVTGAGESIQNLGMIRSGILSLAPAMGQSTKDLINGLFMIESAGFHGAAGLTVLKAASEGAKVGNADLGVVADAVTTALVDYHQPASAAADVTSKLVETVALGKTHLQDLAGALASVLPAASVAHISLDQVLGAMATMTAEGTPAADAATYLRQTILQLSNPTAKAQDEMKSLGLSSIDVANNLGTRGLTGTFNILVDAIEKHVGPAGTVLIDKLKSASHNTSAYQQILANLNPVQQTYIAALADMVGGTKSMQAALELTGGNAAIFNGNVATVSKTTAEAKGNVQGWSLVQGEFNFKLDQAKAGVEVLGVRLGNVLIPIIERLVKDLTPVVVWFGKNKDAAMALAGVVGGVLVAAIAVWAGSTIAALSAVDIASGGLLLAVGALTLGIVYLATHWKQIWTDITSFVKSHIFEISAAFAFLTGGFSLIVEGLVILGMHWQQIWADVKSWTNDFVRFWEGIPGAIVGAIKNLPAEIIFALGALPGDMLSLGEKMASAILNGLGNVGGSIISKITSAIPGSGIVGNALSAIGLASGGIVTRPTLAVVGEAGPEAIIPMSQLAGVDVNAKSLTSLASLGSMVPAVAAGGGSVVGGGGGGSTVVNVNVSGSLVGGTPHDIANVLAPYIQTVLLQKNRRNAVRIGFA